MTNKLGENLKVNDVMSSEPAVCTPDATIQECAQLMVDYDCGEIPVVESEENKKLIGVITDRDITCRVVAAGVDPNDKIENYITSRVVTVQKDETLEQCQQLMSENMVRRLPVVDENMNCIGIVTQAHVARHGSDEEAGELAKNISQSRSGRLDETPTQNLENI